MLAPDEKFDSNLKEAIIRVVAFFDLFDYPLTALEISAHLEFRFRDDHLFNSVQDILDADQNIWQQVEGFYFLSGREEIIITRQSRYNYSARKLKIARRFVRVFSWLPSVRLIALANSIGFYNLRDGSDIDFFIITEPGKIWLSRLYCTGLAKLLNSRPTAKNKRDKICLSFYISSDYLNLSSLRLPSKDPYFDYWLSGLILLYNKKDTYNLFLSANETESGRISPVVNSRPLSPGLLERIAKTIQLKIMPPELKAAMNNSDGVVVSDQVLKFYQSDRRREISEKYEKKVRLILA